MVYHFHFRGSKIDFFQNKVEIWNQHQKLIKSIYDEERGRAGEKGNRGRGKEGEGKRGRKEEGEGGEEGGGGEGENSMLRKLVLKNVWSRTRVRHKGGEGVKKKIIQLFTLIFLYPLPPPNYDNNTRNTWTDHKHNKQLNHLDQRTHQDKSWLPTMPTDKAP